MNNDFIEINGIDIFIRRSLRAKRLSLKIDSTGKFTLVIPKFTIGFNVNRFLEQNAEWINKHTEKAKNIQKLHPKPKYQTGDVFYYFGEKVFLEVLPSPKKRPSIKIRGDKMIIHYKESVETHCNASSAEDKKNKIKKIIEKFYRKKAEEVMHDRLQFFDEHYNFKYNNVVLRNQKTRWGSCSSSKNLNFNWRLIMAPIEVIDYIVVHELCHLKQMNHSPNFWKLVESIMPDYKERKKWLKEKHYLLNC